MRIDVVGVYSVLEATEKCVLVELTILLGDEEFDFGKVTQEIPGAPSSDWQVPWLEHRLDEGGSSGQEQSGSIHGPTKTTRVAFFFHYLDASRPLVTPGGSIALPKATPRPDRLKFMQYEQPC